MNRLSQRPKGDRVQAALHASASEMITEPVVYLDEGWEFWAFRSGDKVVRVPKTGSASSKLRIEAGLLPEVAVTLPAPIASPLALCPFGANDRLIGIYDYIPGVPAGKFRGRFHDDFGARFGRFVRALHSFPVQRALDLGVEDLSGENARRERERQYEDVRTHLLPLLDGVTAGYMQHLFEVYLADTANFEFEPHLVHRDLDGEAHVLIDEDGALSGVLDFSDMVVGNPAIDLWMPLREFADLGIGNHTQAALEAYGATQDQLAAFQSEMVFLQFRWLYLSMLYGLDNGDEPRVERDIASLQRRAVDRN